MTQTSSHESSFLIAVVVASNVERQAGVILPPVWLRVFPEQPDYGPVFSARTQAERDATSITRTTHLLTTLGLKVCPPDEVFFVRQMSDSRDRLRAVVCGVVTSLEPIKKRYFSLVRMPFPIENTKKTQQDIIEALRAL
jgi:hypothetical protein